MAKSKEPTRSKKTTRRAGEVRPKKLRLPKPEYFDWRTFDPSMFANKDDAMIEEMVTCRDNLKELLRHKGKYVVIKGREVIGIYADQRDAEIEAATRFGSEPVFIKEIVAKEPYIYMGGVVY
jgi:hypothetical protein